MNHPANPPPTSDICLLLRAHGEQRWLLYKVAPIVHQLEQPDAVAEEQLAAALAYLEALWIDAHRFAAQTDGAYERLTPSAGLINDAARHYRAAVRRERSVLGARVEQLLTGGHSSGWQQPRSAHEHAGF